MKIIPDIMQKENEKGPFEIWKIEALQSLSCGGDKRFFFVKKVSTAEKEQGHMEEVNQIM